MNLVTFEYPMPGQGLVRFTAYWNGKDYNGKRYVEVYGPGERPGRGAIPIWYHEHGFTRNGGMPYVAVLREALGWKEEGEEE